MSELTYLLIPSDPRQSTSIKQCTFAEAYTVMRDSVGGYVELVRLNIADMYINEEGKLRDLPVNPRATVLAMFEDAISDGDIICGNAILFGTADDIGNETSITPELRSHMLRLLGGFA